MAREVVTSDIKRRMIEQTEALLAKKGLHGTSFTEVLQASGAPRGSLYHHFPGGKEELVLAALGTARDMAILSLESLRGKPAEEIARAFFVLWRTVLSRSNLDAGCAVLSVTVAAHSPALLDGAARVFRDWRVRLGDLLIEGGVPKSRATAIATLMISAAEGAVALSRAEKSFEPLDSVAVELQAVVKATSKKRR